MIIGFGFFHRSVSGIKTEMLAENGIVTLRGEATSQAQKDPATKYAQDVEGVKDVQNEMTVVTVAMKPDEKTKGKKTGEVKWPFWSCYEYFNSFCCGIGQSRDPILSW